MIEAAVNFLVDFPARAPVDTALLLATLFYAVLASRVLYVANKRDHDVSERMQHWQHRLQQAARERDAKARPSAAE